MTAEFPLMITVEFKGVFLSDANKIGTSKFDWMCFEHIKLHSRNEFLIRKNSGKLNINKMSENLRNFENFIEEKNQLCTQTSENLEKSPNAQRCILPVSYPVDLLL